MNNLLSISSNALNLNVNTQRQSLDCNQRSSRSMGVEEFLVNLVNLCKIIDISHENIDLDDALPSGAGSSNDGLDVGKNLTGLNLNICKTLDKLAFSSERDLTREVDETIGLDGLAVRTNGSRSGFSKDLKSNSL